VAPDLTDPAIAAHLEPPPHHQLAAARVVTVLMGRPCLDSNVTDLRTARCITGVAGSDPTSGRAPPLRGSIHPSSSRSQRT